MNPTAAHSPPLAGAQASHHETRRGAGLARRAYGLRCVGLAMGFFLVQTVLWLQHASLFPRLFVLVYCYGWPHFAFLMTRWSAQPGRSERVNLFVDSMVGGMIVVAIKCTWLPSTLILLMFMMNNVAAGGPRLLARGALACCVGFGLGALAFGVQFDWGSVSATTIASAPMLLVYPLSLGVVTYRTSMKLGERSRALKVLSEHDTLTGLLNRATLARHLSDTLARARASRDRVSVLFIDLDGFKTVNDTLGHQHGDHLLTAVALRLMEACGATERIGRYGGDEFVIVSTQRAMQNVEALASRIVLSVNSPLALGSSTIRPCLSVGIAAFPDHGEDEQTLLSKADAAMYEAKGSGTNCAVTYNNGNGIDGEADSFASTDHADAAA
ncbi:diguanylate cyclase (plasmid) [Paraburkholderia sp. PREW-6R]|uniref:GGDEF domain-containing protein n=1 Tax=Paraburkholderia sp. PREW-6R TaxID=3141544 RepID=UPI0031F57C15